MTTTKVGNRGHDIGPVEAEARGRLVELGCTPRLFLRGAADAETHFREWKKARGITTKGAVYEALPDYLREAGPMIAFRSPSFCAYLTVLHEWRRQGDLKRDPAGKPTKTPFALPILRRFAAVLCLDEPGRSKRKIGAGTGHVDEVREKKAAELGQALALLHQAAPRRLSRAESLRAFNLDKVVVATLPDQAYALLADARHDLNKGRGNRTCDRLGWELLLVLEGYPAREAAARAGREIAALRQRRDDAKVKPAKRSATP